MRQRVQVTVISSPVTTRYCAPGSNATLDLDINQIRVGGAWFDYDEQRWKIVTDQEKPKAVIQALKDAVNHIWFISDSKFIEIVEAHAMSEDDVMELMVEDGSFKRQSDGWFVKVRE